MGTLTIVANKDTSWATNPDVATWNTVLNNVVTTLQNYLQPTSNITVTIQCGYGEVGGQAMQAGWLGKSLYFVDSFTYAQVRTALLALTPNSLQSTAYGALSLPSTDPFGGSETMYVSTALSKAIAMDSGVFTDGYVGFASNVSWDLTNTDGTSTASGKFNLFGTMMHEITEVLGREMNCGLNATYYIGDIFTYSGSGTKNHTSSGTRYLSADNGATNFFTMNQNTSGDFGDTATNSSFLAFTPTGYVPVPEPHGDMSYLTIIGWGLTSSGLTSAGISNAPINTVLPLISGTPTVGNALAVSNGTWTNTPTSYAYQWTRNGSNIAAATTSSYTLVSADAGTTCACVVTATNASGSNSATANGVTVGQITPQNTALPVISGDGTRTQWYAGHTLTVTQGSWTNSPTSISHQWKSAASNVGSNSTTYVLVESDAGNTISCVETATNANGSTNATADSVGPAVSSRLYTFRLA